MMILGPKQLENNIYVYLRPFIDDLKMLWETEVDVFNAYCEDNFALRVT